MCFIIQVEILACKGFFTTYLGENAFFADKNFIFLTFNGIIFIIKFIKELI